MQKDMSLTPSNMLPLGTKAPDFSLPDTQGNIVSLSNFSRNSLLLVAFICNHCPYVKHIRHTLMQIGKDYQSRNVGVVAINSNDTVAYPADDMENMKKEVVQAGYTFPYVLDETQAVAKAYDAACTPDFYLFNKERMLIYRGQMDGSRPGSDIPVTGEDLCAAMDAALAGQPVNDQQVPSVGCNIKWK